MVPSVVFFLFLLCCTCIDAVYFDVTTCTDTTPCVFVSPTGNDNNNGTSSLPLRTIQQALTLLKTATIPTTIVLADGTYPGGVVWSGRSLSLTSINGSGSTVIDCGGNARGLWLGSGESSSTVISGITIQNCRAVMGGGMAIVGQTTKPIIRDVTLINNQAGSGGAAALVFSSPTFVNVSISGSKGTNGAGMFILHDASPLTFTQLQAICLAVNVSFPNPLPQGEQAYVNMSNVTFTNNIAVGPGGALLLLAAYRVRCDHCGFTGNTGTSAGAIGAGGACTLVVSDSVFTNNQATTAIGGAMSIQQGTTAVVTNSAFIGNMAKQQGGAIIVGSVAPLSTVQNGGAPLVPTVGVLTSTVNITDSLFDGNRALEGSILFNDVSAQASISDCITRNNVATSQGGIYLLNPDSALRFNVSSCTYENNVAMGNYGADYGSFATNLAFVKPAYSTQIGYSGTSPSIYPVNTSTVLKRSVYNLEPINLKIVLLDTFGQRLNLNESNQTGVTPGLYAKVTTLDNITIPAILIQSVHAKLPTGVADVPVMLVGEMSKTYVVQIFCYPRNITGLRLLVTIKPCNPSDYITYYDSTNFPLCQSAQPQHLSTSFTNGIIVVSCILMACVIILQGLTIWYWNTPVFKGSTPQFMSLMLLGAIIGYLATILSVLDVNHTICKSEYWMMGIAFVLMFGTLALKTWRIRNIFCNETLTGIRLLTTWGLFRWLLLFIALEMLIHIVWISMDPLHSTLQVSNGGQLTTTCTSTHDDVFLIVNLVYKGLIAVVCVIFAYQTRDVASRFNESRQLMIASYNMFVSVIIIAALSLALPDANARRTVYAVGALFVITSTWFVLFTPKLYLTIKKNKKDGHVLSATGTTGTGAGGSGGKNSSQGKTTSHSDHHKVTSSSKTSFNQAINMNPVSSSPTPSLRSSKGNSVPSTAPASPILPHNKLALNLTQRSSMSNLHGPTGMSSPVGGSSPHISAIAMHMPRAQLPSLTLSRAALSPLQIQEDDNTNPDHVMVETEPFPSDSTIDREQQQQTRRTSQPLIFADTTSSLEMGNINHHSMRGIPPASQYFINALP